MSILSPIGDAVMEFKNVSRLKRASFNRERREMHERLWGKMEIGIYARPHLLSSPPGEEIADDGFEFFRGGLVNSDAGHLVRRTMIFSPWDSIINHGTAS
jgi:hypothetical protein